MPHIHTKPGEHDHTASAFIIRTDFKEPKLLLHFHRKLHKYAQFGGHIETIETLWQTIIHELREESGYDASQLRVLQPKQRIKSLPRAKLHPMPVCHNTHLITDLTTTAEHFHTDTIYGLIATENPRYKPVCGESEDIILLTRQELVDFPPDKILSSVLEVGLFMFDVCLPDWEAVETGNFQ